MSRGTWRGESRVSVRWENRRCIWWVFEKGVRAVGIRVRKGGQRLLLRLL